MGPALCQEHQDQCNVDVNSEREFRDNLTQTP